MAVNASFGRRARWLMPLLATVMFLVGAALVPKMASADAHPNLPTISASDLLLKMQLAHVDGVDATVKTTANLGIPSLPKMAGSNSSPSYMDFLSGTQTFHAWTSDNGNARLQLPNSAAETDLIRNGTDLYVWQSTGQKVTHVVLPEKGSEQKTATPPETDLTPQAMAQQFLSNIDPTTQITTTDTTNVAGRDAYELVLTPKSTTSLIGQVRIAVDSANFTPLRVEILARGANKPAFQIAYESVRFNRPANSVFAFTPPKGSAITTHDMTKPSKQDSAAPSETAHSFPSVVGTGWDTVVILPGTPPVPQTSSDKHNEQQNAMRQVLKATTPVKGSFGSGQLLHTAVVNVVLLDDGRVALGSTDQATLLAAIPTK